MGNPDIIRAAIIGASGYTGVELVRILSSHPSAEITLLASSSHAGRMYSELYPQFRGLADMEMSDPSVLDTTEADLIFLALPHGISMEFVGKHDLESVPVIDLSADFRISSAGVYEDWYETRHCCKNKLQNAVYGLPELNRDRIRNARLVANPGCYPTSVILPLAPLLAAGLIEPEGIVIDSKSGVTGAGNKPRASTHYPTVNEGFAAYGLKHHRHTPEIEQALTGAAGSQVTVQFTPHLLPVNRGILSTIYARPSNGATEQDVRSALQTAYGHEPFVRLADNPPSLDSVRGSNFCDIYTTLDKRTGNLLVVSVIDNLVKGAAGQAVQNMNILFSQDETAGLNAIPLSP